MFEVDDITISGQFIVSANPTGVGPPIPVTGISGISGAHHASSASLLGDPLSFPLPVANVMISGSTDLKLKAAPMLWIRSSTSSPVLPQNIIIGDVLGPVGVVAQTFITTWVNETTITVTSPELSVTAATVGLGPLSWSGPEIHFGVQQNTGAKSDTGAQAQTGAETRTGVKASIGNHTVAAVLDGPTIARIDAVDAAQWQSIGKLWVSKKGFDIQHPTKENHRLRYICVEGPSAEVYLRGKLENNNVIELPEYWRNLVDVETIGVTLTPIGVYQELYVEKIEWGKRIIVKNNSSGIINCSYVVFAERNDVEKNIPEYKGLTPYDYPGDNNEYVINGKIMCE